MLSKLSSYQIKSMTDMSKYTRLYRKHPIPTDVYVVASKHGECRIGWSIDAKQRAKTTKTSNPTSELVFKAEVDNLDLAKRVVYNVMNAYDNRRITRRGSGGQMWLAVPKEEVVERLRAESAKQKKAAGIFRARYPHQFGRMD